MPWCEKGADADAVLRALCCKKPTEYRPVCICYLQPCTYCLPANSYTTSATCQLVHTGYVPLLRFDCAAYPTAAAEQCTVNDISNEVAADTGVKNTAQKMRQTAFLPPAPAPMPSRSNLAARRAQGRWAHPAGSGNMNARRAQPLAYGCTSTCRSINV
jgi:hypothetical protein